MCIDFLSHRHQGTESCDYSITLGTGESLTTATLAHMNSVRQESCDDMDGKNLAYIKSQYTKTGAQPAYGVTVKSTSSSGGTCVLKYGWAPAKSGGSGSSSTMSVIVYNKVICTDDDTNFVARKYYLRAWHSIPSGDDNWGSCIGSYSDSHCAAIGAMTWTKVTASTKDKVEHAFAAQ